MKKIFFCCKILTFFLLIFFIRISAYASTLNCATATNINVPVDECQALLDLYDSTDGPNRSIPAGQWDTDTDVCTRPGISCSNFLGQDQVVGINLDSSSLSGTLTDSLINLSRLSSIVLSNNNLYGQLPAIWGSNMPYLNTIILTNNFLSGTLPGEWSGMTALDTLYLNSNQFTGTLPLSWGQWTAIQRVDFSSNHFNGVLPSSWSGWVSIGQFRARENNFTGTIPLSWGESWLNLYDIDISYNHLKGPLPDLNIWFSIQTISLLFNDIDKQLPSSWGNLSTLDVVDLRYNNIEGQLPSSWGGMAIVSNILLDHNKLTGSIPVAWITGLQDRGGGYINVSNNYCIQGSGYGVNQTWVNNNVNTSNQVGLCTPTVISPTTITGSNPWIVTGTAVSGGQVFLYNGTGALLTTGTGNASGVFILGPLVITTGVYYNFMPVVQYSGYVLTGNIYGPFFVVPLIPPTSPTYIVSPSSGITSGTIVTITLTNIASGNTVSLPGSMCTPNPSTGGNVICIGEGSDLGNNPVVTVTGTGGVTTGVISMSITVPSSTGTTNISSFGGGGGGGGTSFIPFVPNVTGSNLLSGSTTNTGVNAFLPPTILIQSSSVIGLENNTCYSPDMSISIFNQGNEISSTYKDALLFSAQYELTKYRGTLDFMPNKGMTRQEAAKIFSQYAVRVLCRKTQLQYKNNFIDIDNADLSLIPYIKQSYELGIFKGDSFGRFRPNDYLTKNELEAIITRLITNVTPTENTINRRSQYETFLLSLDLPPMDNSSRSKVIETLYLIYKNQSFIKTSNGYRIIQQ